MDSSHLNRPQRMVFRFIEESEDETLEAYSYGNGRFTCGTPNADDHVCFTTHKTGTSLEILIEDSQLIAWLNDTVPGTYCFENEQLYMNTSMDLLLPCYSSLKERFTYDRTAKQSFEALELFIQHFLEEGSVFGIFGFEYLYECDILTEQHFYDIQCQHRSMVEDLEDLDQLIYQVDVPDPADVENESLSPDSIRPELRNAVQKREIGAVASVLTKYRRTVNAKMLCFAIWFYEPSVFRLLLNHGAQVEGSDVMADPLHRAAKAGNMDAVTLLLGYGAEIEGGKFSESVTPLTGASSGGHLHLVKYLIDKGARVDGNVYKTPLSRAIKRGHIEVVKYLLACGADLTAAVPRSMRFEGATRVAHDLEEVLSSHISEMKSGDREVLLSRAVTEGNLDYVGILCACGCYVEPGEYTRSFQTTAEMGSIDLVRDLLDQSSPISPTSPLHIAVAKGNLDLFHFLVGHGVSVQFSRQLDFNWPSQWDFTSPSQCHTPPAAPFRKVRPSRFIERRKLYCVFLNPYPMDKMILNSLLAQAKTYHAMPKGYPLTQTSNLESCPAVAAIRTQERRRIGRKLLTKVSKSLEKLVVAGRDQTASAELMALTEQIDTSLITWRKGTRAIRDIIDGYPLFEGT